MSWTYNIAPPNGWKSFLLNQTPAHSLSEVSNFYRPCISGQCYLLPTARIRENFLAESNDKTNRWLINSGQGDGGGDFRLSSTAFRQEYSLTFTHC